MLQKLTKSEDFNSTIICQETINYKIRTLVQKIVFEKYIRAKKNMCAKQTVYEANSSCREQTKGKNCIEKTLKK